MSDNHKLLSWALVGCCLLLAAHPGDANYRFPLDGHRALSGTFGELRSNHYHSGIDLKTGGKTGAPVRAIDDGYVYRILVSPFGYGNALYIKHPDGNFSVYGHLSHFQDRITRLVEDRQWADRQMSQDLYLGQHDLPVSKGDIIAWSGNSGSSQGPHLHFEIRDPQERILNPLEWFRSEIADARPPVLQQIGIEPLDIDSRVNGAFDKLSLVPEGSAGQYRIAQLIQVQGRIGIEYEGHDLLDAAANHCGINYARLYLDEELIHEFALDRYAFDEKRLINLHFDYAHFQKTKKKLQRAYVEPGNLFPANRPYRDQGTLLLTDDLVHNLRLELGDFHGNTTRLDARIQRKTAPGSFPAQPVYHAEPVVQVDIRRNILLLRATKPHASYQGGLLVESIYGEQSRLMPAYMDAKGMVFLMPLDRYRYPRIIRDEIGKWVHTFPLMEELLPFQNNLIEAGPLTLMVPYRSVADRVPIEILPENAPGPVVGELYRIGSPGIPVLEPFVVSIRPPENWQGGKLVVARQKGARWEFLGASPGEGGAIVGSSLEFGAFALIADPAGPVIRPQNFSHQGILSGSIDRLSLHVSDAVSDLDHMSLYATVDGQWVPFSYDFRINSITWRWKQRPAAGWHDLEVSLRDKAGNLSIGRFRFKT